MTTADKLITQVKKNTDTALKENVINIENATLDHVNAIESAYFKIKEANEIVSNYNKKLKIRLDNSTKAYNSSINRLFQLDNNRKFLFWTGILFSILTPILLLLNLFI